MVSCCGSFSRVCVLTYVSNRDLNIPYAAGCIPCLAALSIWSACIGCMVNVFGWIHFFHTSASASALDGSIRCNPDLIIHRMFRWNSLVGFLLCMAFRFGLWLMMCQRSTVAAVRGLRGLITRGIHASTPVHFIVCTYGGPFFPLLPYSLDHARASVSSCQNLVITVLGSTRAPVMPQYTAPWSAEHVAYSHVPAAVTSRSGVICACMRPYSLCIHAHGVYAMCGMMHA